MRGFVCMCMMWIWIDVYIYMGGLMTRPTDTSPPHNTTQWADGMPRLKLCFAVLDRLLQQRAPRLHQHFAETGVHVAHFSSRYEC